MALRAAKSRSPPFPATAAADGPRSQTPKQDGSVKLPSLVGEGENIAILLALYFLQGVPIGLAASVPLFLKERVGLSDIATFGFCSWPYALKLLWAPIVDAVFSPSFGRRKTWIVPTQYLAGFMLLLLSSVLDSLLDSDPPQILALTVGFFVLYFLVATQDIAVDGWALTLLRPENVGYASSCNSIGQTLGYIVAYASFLAGTSAEFCNRFRSEPLPVGAVSMATFLQFWGVVFIISTTVLWIFKREDDVRAGEMAPGGLGKAYQDMWSVIKLQNVWWLAVIMVTSKLSYMTEGAVQYELMERGVTRDELLMITMPLVPLELVVTAIISRWMAGPKPLTAYLWTIPARCVGIAAYIALFYFSPALLAASGDTTALLATFFVITVLYRLPCQINFSAQMAFFAKVSDPAIGGTYMTLLNTLSNLGSMVASQVALRSIDGIGKVIPTEETVDGFVLVSAASVVYGVLWTLYFRHVLLKLEAAPLSQWSLSRVSPN